jgi:RND family efflux transporter MFP subunit
MTMKYARSIVIALAAALLVPAAACKKSEDGQKNLPPPTGEGAKPLPEIPTVATGDAGIDQPVSNDDDATTTGTLMPRQEVKVAAKSSGTIVELKVDEGSKVKKGDVLFRLDSSDAALMRRTAQTTLDAAQLALKTAQREYDRLKGLVEQNAMPRQQLDQLEAQRDGAKLQIAQAKNQIAMANKQIGDATVRAPISGVVIAKMMSVGEYATMMPPSTIVVVQDQSKLELKFRVPERGLAIAKKGDAVTVEISSLGITREATISEIAPQLDPRTRTLELTVVLDNADGSLKPGLMATVRRGDDNKAPLAPTTTPAAPKTNDAAAKGAVDAGAAAAAPKVVAPASADKAPASAEKTP